MSAPTSAIPPAQWVSEIPGRFAPFLVIDKRNPSAMTASTSTSAQLGYLSRAESASNEFNTPLTDIIELGTNFNVGSIDDIPDTKVSISCYDVGVSNMALLCGKHVANPGTTSFGFNDLNTANIDIIRQYAAPNGTIFMSEFMSNHVIEEYGASLKAKGESMESYSLVGFNTAAFRGFIQTKAYIVQSADVTAQSFSIGSLLGTNEAPYQIPTLTGPANYWQQNGHNYFLKIERWRPATGWVEVKEGASVGTGVCKYTSGSTTLAFQASTDLTAGDVYLLTYMTYATNVNVLSADSGVNQTNNPGYAFNVIPQLKLDTSDPIAVPTRLTPITISAQNISRGQQFDLKLSMKRDRAEGIGDTTGFFGPSDAPAVTLSLDVKQTDFGLNSIMQAGTPYGSDTGGSTANDFFDPAYTVREQLATAVPTVVTINDPRTAGTVLKTITAPTSVYNQRQLQTPNKGPATIKYSGKDYVGNISISVTH